MSARLFRVRLRSRGCRKLRVHSLTHPSRAACLAIIPMWHYESQPPPPLLLRLPPAAAAAAAAPHLLQGGVGNAVAGDAQVGEAVVQFVEELDEGSVLGRLVGQHVGELVSQVLHQPGLRHVAEDHAGDQRHVCRGGGQS